MLGKEWVLVHEGGSEVIPSPMSEYNEYLLKIMTWVLTFFGVV